MPEPAADIPSRVKSAPESAYAWTRLFAALVLSAVGGVGMWSVIVALPAVQAEFGVARSAASLPYTVTMICFGFGGILMGRLSDRVGIFVPVVGAAVGLGLGYMVASGATSLWQFALAQGLLVGVASSVTFAPIIADTSLWFTRHRGMAVAIIASGSYLAGTVWPPVVQHFIETSGWRWTYRGIAVFCVTAMVPLTLALRRRSPLTEMATTIPHVMSWSPRPLGMSPAGGIVPAYAVIVREFFPPEEAGVRVSAVLMATVFGMALGGWVSGVTFDLTGTYQAAFMNGILWNLLNLTIAVALLRRPATPAARGYASR